MAALCRRHGINSATLYNWKGKGKYGGLEVSEAKRLKGQRTARPFEMTPFIRFLWAQLDNLKPHLRERVELRVALHKHPGITGRGDRHRYPAGGSRRDVGHLEQPAVRLQSVNLAVLPACQRELELNDLEAARAAGVDALVAVYHSDHRALCAHERDRPFRIVNLLDIVGQSTA